MVSSYLAKFSYRAGTLEEITAEKNTPKSLENHPYQIDAMGSRRNPISIGIFQDDVNVDPKSGFWVNPERIIDEISQNPC